MGWQEEQSSGGSGSVIRYVWFDGNLFAFVREYNATANGVWHRDGVGPYIRTRAGPECTWWEADIAFYMGGLAPNQTDIYRSEDGLSWTLDWTIPPAWNPVPSHFHTINAYGDYLWAISNEGGAGGTAHIVRRDRDGNWIEHSTYNPNLDPTRDRGILGFGGDIYWSNMDFVRYWDGAAWVPEPTLNGQCGASSFMSVIDNVLYIGSSAHLPYSGGYFRRTPSSGWSFLHLPVPGTGWDIRPLVLGGDGQIYTISTDGTAFRVYRLDGGIFTLVFYHPGGWPWSLNDSSVGVEPDGTMYIGTRTGGVPGIVRFLAFVPDYDLTPAGGGLMPQMMDVDADGNALFFGAYNAAGQPILLRVPLPLSSSSIASNMFDPGAGTSINLKCLNRGGNLAISGDFGVNDAVRVSDDGGVTLTDIDADWGAEMAQPLLADPNDIDEMLVCLQTVQDVVETEDGGLNWRTNNPAIGFSPTAAAVLPESDELVLAGPGGELVYSPNRGTQLRSIVAGFLGTCVAIEGI